MIDRLEERAARFLLRREQSDWSAADQQALDSWLAESMRHKAVYWRLRHGWSQADRVGALNLPAQPVRERAPFFGAVWLKAAALIAAMLIPLALATMTVFDWNAQPEYTYYNTKLGERKVIAFPDGTRVDLNTDSAIRVELTDRKRIVRLDRGEAFFDVAHDRTRPFYVFTGDRLVKVLGTKFGIRREGARTVAAVVEGRVQFGRVVKGEVRETLILKRGDSAISQGSQTLAVYDKMDAVTNNLGWMRGLLIFDRMSLSDAAGEFNRYNHRKLVIADEKLGKIRIGGAFRPENVETFARLMADAYGLRVEETETEIRVSQD